MEILLESNSGMQYPKASVHQQAFQTMDFRRDSSWLAVFFMILLACLGTENSLGEEGEKNAIRLILDLNDGSHIMGSPTRETIPFQSSLAKVNIPLKSISAIQFKKDHETVKISFQNGDQLQGVLNLDAIEVVELP